MRSHLRGQTDPEHQKGTEPVKHTCTTSHAHAHTCARAHTRTPPHAHTTTRARTHSHTRTNTRTGFRQMFLLCNPGVRWNERRHVDENGVYPTFDGLATALLPLHEEVAAFPLGQPTGAEHGLSLTRRSWASHVGQHDHDATHKRDCEVIVKVGQLTPQYIVSHAKPAPVTAYVAPAQSVTDAASALVTEYATAVGVTHTTPTPAVVPSASASGGVFLTRGPCATDHRRKRGSDTARASREHPRPRRGTDLGPCASDH